MENQQEVLINEFLQATCASHHVTARFFLGKNKWNLARAIENFKNTNRATPEESKLKNKDCSKIGRSSLGKSSTDERTTGTAQLSLSLQRFKNANHLTPRDSKLQSNLGNGCSKIGRSSLGGSLTEKDRTSTSLSYVRSFSQDETSGFKNANHLLPGDSKLEINLGNGCFTATGRSSLGGSSTDDRTRFSEDKKTLLQDSHYNRSSSSLAAMQSIQDIRCSFRDIGDIHSKREQSLKNLKEDIKEKDTSILLKNWLIIFNEDSETTETQEEMRNFKRCTEKKKRDFDELTLSQLKEECTTKDLRIRSANEEIRRLNIDIEKKNRDFDDIQQTVLELKEECEKKDSKISDAKQEIANLKFCMGKNNGEYNDLRDSLSEMQRECEEKASSIMDAQMEIDKLGQIIKDRDEV